MQIKAERTNIRTAYFLAFVEKKHSFNQLQTNPP